MASRVTCFFIEPSNTAVESLRRYSSKPCSGVRGYHDADIAIGVSTWALPHHGAGDLPSDALKADPRWPKACACGYMFEADDNWQHNMRRHFVDKATGVKYQLHDAPPGAMWNADWMIRDGLRTADDGMWLCVRLPNGDDWLVDGPSTNGPGWQRTGVPPKITAQPSIFASEGRPNSYHGWLRDGVLEEV